MKALVFERNLPRFAASRVASLLGSGKGVGVGPLRLLEAEPPELPGPDWHRVWPVLSGICGSDLATLDGRSSRYFEELVSFPFVPGHEVVGVLDGDAVAADGTAVAAGTRVVLEPVLGCAARRIDPPCPACAAGRTGDCELVAFGHLRPGLQTGFCADTGGGWSAAGLVAHRSQLHRVADGLTDADAVTVEPVACAVHAALAAGIRDGDTVAVLGAGTVGLTVVAAVAHLAATGRLAVPAAVLVGARYPGQRELAVALGATEALPPDHLARAVRRRSRSLAVGAPTGGGQRLTGGADVVLDCVGSAASIAQALDMVRPRGRIALVGMPGKVSVDLTSLWHREVSLAGTYAYGVEHVPGGPGPGGEGSPGGEGRAGGEPVRTFDLAAEVVAAKGTGRLVSARYPLERFEEAVAHAGAAGRRGAVKVAFELPAPRKSKKGST
ncbi:MAG TPA: zinc-binding dehydrogenase [Acidimicrobiales bacterium]|nr:zinc-binding dehydrogenase [Acidimicrobiales bacterium]